MTKTASLSWLQFLGFDQPIQSPNPLHSDALLIGVDESVVSEIVGEFRQLELNVYFVLIVGAADPIEPADEDEIVEVLVGGLNPTKRYGVEYVWSTSVDAWLRSGLKPRSRTSFDEAAAQNVKVNTRAGREAEVDAFYCGDSTFSKLKNERLIVEIAGGKVLGIFHGSAKTNEDALQLTMAGSAPNRRQVQKPGAFNSRLSNCFATKIQPLRPCKILT